VLDLSDIDLEEIADALADRTDYEHHWLIDPDTGEIAFWTADTGIDGQTPVDLDELDLVVIGPLPSWVWYQDMADFAEGITDERAGRRLTRAIQGKGTKIVLIPLWSSAMTSRLDRVQVQDAGVDAVAAELIGGSQTVVQRDTRAGQRHLAGRAGPHELRAAGREGLIQKPSVLIDVERENQGCPPTGY